MKKPDMVTDIFQFAQIVRRDHRRKFLVHDLRCKQALYSLDALPDQGHQRSHRKTNISLPRTPMITGTCFFIPLKKLQFCDFLPDEIVPSVHGKTWFETEDRSSGKSAPDPLLYNLPENNCHLRYRKTVSFASSFSYTGIPSIWISLHLAL